MSDLTLRANFASNSLTGTLSNFVFQDDSYLDGSANIAASITGSNFTGSVSGAVEGASEVYDLSGDVDGDFYREDESLIGMHVYLLTIGRMSGNEFEDFGWGVAER